MKLINFITYAILLIILSVSTKAKIVKPNKDFKLTQYSVFFPLKKFAAIPKEFKKSEIFLKKDEIKGVKYTIVKENYKIVIFIQVFQGTIIDFYLLLPSYFMHNIFHRELIKKYGKQDKYLKVERSGLYFWNKPDFKMTYKAMCSLSCFPFYLSMTSLKFPGKGVEWRPLLKLFN